MNKRILVIVGLILILATVTAFSLMIFFEIQQGKSEGLAFAKKRNKYKCVNEVLKGKQICTEFSCFLKNHYFFQTCIDNAKPSARLCKNIPSMGNLYQFETWKNKQCKKNGRKDKGCRDIWEKVRNSCKAEDD